MLIIFISYFDAPRKQWQSTRWLKSIGKMPNECKIDKEHSLARLFLSDFFIFIIWMWVCVCVSARVIDFARDTIYWDFNGVFFFLFHSNRFWFLPLFTFFIFRNTKINVFRFFPVKLSLHVWCTPVFLIGSSDLTRSRPDLFWTLEKFQVSSGIWNIPIGSPKVGIESARTRSGFGITIRLETLELT